MFQFLNNIPQVTKNLLLLNVFAFILTAFFENQGINLNSLLGAHYVNSPLFEPFQMVTYFFMHGDIMHILFNMLALVMLGGHLERLWGPKRYFIFYVASAIGAFAFYNALGVYQISQLEDKILASNLDLRLIQDAIKTGQFNLLNEMPFSQDVISYISKSISPMIGASGGVFGIMAAFALLFPNTEFYLYFAIPVKAKYLVSFYFIYEVYQSFFVTQGDNIAHLAHVGGAVVGAIFVFFWRKDRTNFY